MLQTHVVFLNLLHQFLIRKLINYSLVNKDYRLANKDYSFANKVSHYANKYFESQLNFESQSHNDSCASQFNVTSHPPTKSALAEMFPFGHSGSFEMFRPV